jgi:PTH1 family peptidyl-tRNA hydrolase
MAVDAIAARYGCAPWKGKFRGLITQGKSGVVDFLLLKPQTFMNLSGESAAEVLKFYQLQAKQVVVFHDDLDLIAGQVKVKQAGGSGGHNGLKSLDAHLGPNYWRVRLGIGRPMTEQGVPVKGDAVTDYVLNPFSKADKTWLAPLLLKIADNASVLYEDPLDAHLHNLANA